MSTHQITQIRVGGHRIGIVGLKSALSEVAETCSGRDDEQIASELLVRLEENNYFPNAAREEYKRALWKEFLKFTGRPVEYSAEDGLEIKVLGPGCASCNKLEQDLMTVMAEINLPADIEHVTDVSEIGGYGVMGTPALIINGEVKSVGSVPPKPKLKAWLMEIGLK